MCVRASPFSPRSSLPLRAPSLPTAAFRGCAPPVAVPLAPPSHLSRTAGRGTQNTQHTQTGRQAPRRRIHPKPAFLPQSLPRCLIRAPLRQSVRSATSPQPAAGGAGRTRHGAGGGARAPLPRKQTHAADGARGSREGSERSPGGCSPHPRPRPSARRAQAAPRSPAGRPAGPPPGAPPGAAGYPALPARSVRPVRGAPRLTSPPGAARRPAAPQPPPRPRPRRARPAPPRHWAARPGPGPGQPGGEGRGLASAAGHGQQKRLCLPQKPPSASRKPPVNRGLEPGAPPRFPMPTPGSGMPPGAPLSA